MPYISIKDLPVRIQRHLPIHAQEIYKEAFNTAWVEYSDEQTAFKVAWAAVKKSMRKTGMGLGS